MAALKTCNPRALPLLSGTGRFLSLWEIGGPDQVRTDDLRNAIAALFQLSYEPKSELPKSRLPRGNARTFYPSSFIRKVTVQV